MRRYLYLLIVGFGPLFNVLAQTYSLQGILKEEETELPIAYATVIAYALEDSTIMGTAVSLEDGTFVLESMYPGDYRLAVSCLGYKPLANSFSIPMASPLQLFLQKAALQLDEIVVASKPNSVRIQKDRMVVDVKNYAVTSGKRVSELLKILPGVSSGSAGLSVLGKNAIVYLNGRPTQLAGDELMRYLDNLNASDVEKVEIINNPSARYEAGHDGAILDIRLKRRADLGFNGTGWLSMTFKSSGLVTAPAASLNYRNEKVNLYGTYSLSNGKYKHTYTGLSRYADLEHPVQYDEHTTYRPKGTDNYVTAGLDFFPNDRHTFGLLMTGYFYNGGNTNQTTTQVSAWGSSQIDSTIISPIDMDTYTQYVTSNLNYAWKIDTVGSFLNMDVNYFYIHQKQEQSILSNYYQGGNTLRPQTGKQHSVDFSSKLFNARVDYTTRFWQDGQLESGLKYDYIDRGNDYLAFIKNDGSAWMDDASSTNYMQYKEHIGAAYLQLSKSFGPWRLETGLRYELTRQEGWQAIGDRAFAHTYSGWYPSALISYRIKAGSSLSASYSKKISRPSMSMLNPFRFYESPYVCQTGNPDLQPSKFHSLTVTYALHPFSFSLLYNRRNNLFIQEPSQNDETKELTYTYRNFGKRDQIGASAYLPFTICKWWRFSFNLYGAYEKLNSSYMGAPYNHHFFSGNAGMVNTFVLPKDFSIGLNANYYTARWNIAMHKKNWGMLDMTVSKSLWDGKGDVSLTVSDPFRWNTSRTSFIYQNINRTGSAIPDLRYVKVSFQYSFGSDKIKRNRRRSTGLEENQSRMF